MEDVLTGEGSADEPESSSLVFALLYGPLVQFARQPGGQAPTVVAMPPGLPVSVDTVFRHPPMAEPPDNLAHFCFCPVMKLRQPSELTFCLTDSNGGQLYCLSIQYLCPQDESELQRRKSNGSEEDRRLRHRPVALCILSPRPIISCLEKMLRSLVPNVMQVCAPL